MVGAMVAINGGKAKLPKPLRIEHPERPSAKSEDGPKPMSVAAFEQHIKKGGGKTS